MARNNKKKQRNKKNKNSASSSQVNLNSASTSQVELNEPNIDETNVVEDTISQIDTPEAENLVDDTENALNLNDEPDLNDEPTDINGVKPDETEIKKNNEVDIEKEVAATELPIESTSDGIEAPEEKLNETSEVNDVEQDTEPATDPETNVKEDIEPVPEVSHVETAEPGIETLVTTEKNSNEAEQIEIPEDQKDSEQLTNQEETAHETLTENETDTKLPIDNEDPSGKQLVKEEGSTLERELDETFPEEEPELNIVGNISKDNDTETIDDDTIEQPKQIDETESTITSSVPALPPRRPEPLITTEAVPNQSNEGAIPPPLPARSPSMENNLPYIADNTPLNEHSMILNRLDMTIKNLKDEDKFIPKPEQQPEENVITDADSIWAKIIEDPVTNIPKFADTIETTLTKGIDPILRPQIWNAFTLSYCNDWEPIYKVLAGKPSIENKETLVEQIKTYQELQQTDVDAIYNILSALVSLDSSIQPTENSLALAVSIYSVYQNELDSFRIMLTLLKSYDGVALYYENSEALSILLYQFDRLMEEDCHDLYTHLIKKGLRTSMFATDWFLSSFSKVLPLESSPHVLDVVILEGVPSLLKFAISLMTKNEETLLKLEFDDLFFYCKNRLFEPYIKGSTEENEEEDTIDDISSVEHKKLTALTKDNFDVDQFLNDALEKTRINPELLKRYNDEYLEIHRNELAQEEQFQQMRDENTKLQKEVRELERDYTSLNREHVTIANELLQNHIKIEGVLEANTKMKMEILQLRKQLDTQVKKNNGNSSALVPNDIQSDLDKTLKKNSKVMQQNLIYQDRITSLESTISAIKRATAEGIDYDIENGISSGTFKSPILSGGWTGFKKVFK